MSRDNKYLKCEVTSSISVDEFKRGVWVSLAQGDAPLDVFETEISKVDICHHEVFVSNIGIELSYQASVGYHRQEPYIAYETYYEDEPYITTETYYDYNTKSNQTRQVTKYRKFQRQRQVTKYKTVTDWSVYNGEHSQRAIAAAENRSYVELDGKRFLKSFTGISPEEMKMVEDDSFCLSEYAKKAVDEENLVTAMVSARAKIPGDEYKDFNPEVKNISSRQDALIKAERYEATINYKGKEYKKDAFAFGKLDVRGDQVENNVSLKNETQKMWDDTEKRCKERMDAVEGNVWQRIMPLSIATYAVMILSVILSFLIRSTPLVIICFVASLAIHIASVVLIKKSVNEEISVAEKETDDYTNETANAVKNYARTHISKVLDALNRKLSALGYAPASLKELGVDENDV